MEKTNSLATRSLGRGSTSQPLLSSFNNEGRVTTRSLHQFATHGILASLFLDSEKAYPS
jgi:hypothetical protein